MQQISYETAEVGSDDFETYTIFYNNFLMQRAIMQQAAMAKDTEKGIAPRFLLEVWLRRRINKWIKSYDSYPNFERLVLGFIAADFCKYSSK